MITREPVLRTDRLSLLRPVPEDLAAVVAVHGDPETNRHNPDGPTPPERCEVWLRAWIEEWSRNGIGYFAVAPLAPAEPVEVIGFAGLKLATVRLAGGEERRALNLYYRFRPSAWGRGLAEEAARAALDFARPRFPELPCYAVIRPENTPSRRLAAKLGLRENGEVDTAGRRVHLLVDPD